MSVTQKDIADRLNISRSLVARALKEYPEVAESTRLRVREIALEMGYDASDNREARILIGRRYGQQLKTGTVAVTFAFEGSLDKIPFFVPVLEGLEDEAKLQNVSICLCPWRKNELPPLIRGRSVDGVIMLGSNPMSEALEQTGLPVAYFHWQTETAESVRPDDRGAACMATRHLLELGHRRIAFLSLSSQAANAWGDRLAGYRDAMEEYGVEVCESLVETSLGWPTYAPDTYCAGCDTCAACVGWATLMEKNGGFQGRDKLPFTALVCYNDQIAMGAITQARQNGVEVPRDLSVVGFDNVSKQLHFSPVITSIDFPRYDMGREAMRLMSLAINREDGNNQVEHTHSIFPTRLAIHESTQAPAGENP